jgi:hypothetical protein
MAIRGRKPTATVIRLATGNPGKRPIPAGEPVPEGEIEKPPKLKGRAAELWDRFIARAHWLTWADGPKSMMWCHLHAEFERAPGKMQSARIAQLRALGSELGLDPASRARLGAKGDNGKPKDPAEKYFSA